MGADFSRVRFNPLLDYAGVELKQGGVLLDADANELMAIVDRRLRALASDVLGRATVSSTTADAFKITRRGAARCRSARAGSTSTACSPRTMARRPTDPAKRVFDDLMAETAVRRSDPPTPRSPICPTRRPCRPPDATSSTSTSGTARSRISSSPTWSRARSASRRARACRPSGRCACSPTMPAPAPPARSPDADVPGWSDLIAPSTGVLTTGTFEVAPVDDPCELPPTGGYRGLENQLYRVEIHDPGQPGGAATFKWSRENASVGSRVASIISGSELELETLGRDDVLRFNTGDWVEIIDDVREFSQAPRRDARASPSIEATRRIQFTPALPADDAAAALSRQRLPGDAQPAGAPLGPERTWSSAPMPSGTPVQVQDLDAAGSTGVIAVPAAGTTLLLENGVTVSFASTGAKGFRAGDYWVFAARTADASVELLDRAPPRGIHHHYARLGIWDVGAGHRDRLPPPLAAGAARATTAAAPPASPRESHASGQFTIQDAVNQVRADRRHRLPRARANTRCASRCG